METLIKNAIKTNLFVVDEDYTFRVSLKNSLKEKYGDDINVSVFPDSKSCFNAIRTTEEKPDIMVLNYCENMQLDKSNRDDALSSFQKLSPHSLIIIISNRKNVECAQKALSQGAQDFVIKDQFANEHVFAAIQKCLHPSRI
jgi:DNA-binding NtrC family response regulator